MTSAENERERAAEAASSGWLAERLGWDAIVASLSSRRIPRRNVAFYLGGTMLLLLFVLVSSGILLVLYYQPDVALAHASVDRIAGQIPYGNLIRNVHLWSGDLFVAILMAQLFVIVVRRAFKPPQELGWFTGIALLIVGVGLAFTGAILPWSQRAYADARVGSEMAKYVPLIGSWLRGFMRGGEEVTSSTLGHAYGFHVAALPATLTVVLAVHLFVLSRRRVVAETDEKLTLPLYPDFFVRLAAVLTGVFVVIMTLAIFFDRTVGVPADPLAPSVGDARPPWYFLPIHQIVRIAPRQLLGMEGARFLVGAASVLALVFTALPFIDRRGSKVTAYFAWVLLLVFSLLAFSGLR